MLVKIEAWILIFPGMDFHFPSMSVPPDTFFRLWCDAAVIATQPLLPCRFCSDNYKLRFKLSLL